MQNIRSRLAKNEVVLVAGVGRIMNHNIWQIIGMQGGFHGLWFDHEHCGFTTQELEVGTLACRSVGLDCFVRIAPTDYALVTRVMEAGGGGVMAAMIQSAEHAEQFVKWTKFFPRGSRGLNTGGFDAGFGKLGAKEFTEKANRDSFLAIQIETLTALEDVDAIAAIDAVDLLFLGPVDMSQALGVTGDFFHPKCIEAMERIDAACRKHGKHWGAVTANPKHADLLYEKGCRMLSPASDVKVINAGVQSIKRDYGRFFGT